MGSLPASESLVETLAGQLRRELGFRMLANRGLCCDPAIVPYARINTDNEVVTIIPTLAAIDCRPGFCTRTLFLIDAKAAWCSPGLAFGENLLGRQGERVRIGYEASSTARIIPSLESLLSDSISYQRVETRQRALPTLDTRDWYGDDQKRVAGPPTRTMRDIYSLKFLAGEK